MKKLILSLAALAFATLLFSQGNKNDNQDNIKKDAVVTIQTGYQTVP